MIARETHDARRQSSVVIDSELFSVIAGQVAELISGAVVLETFEKRTVGLAASAKRAKVGDFLALVTEQLDATHQMLEVIPAIDIDARRTTSPLTDADARLLRRAPLPLQVMVPVTVGR